MKEYNIDRLSPYNLMFKKYRLWVKLCLMFMLFLFIILYFYNYFCDFSLFTTALLILYTCVIYFILEYLLNREERIVIRKYYPYVYEYDKKRILKILVHEFKVDNPNKKLYKRKNIMFEILKMKDLRIVNDNITSLLLSIFLWLLPYYISNNKELMHNYLLVILICLGIIIFFFMIKSIVNNIYGICNVKKRNLLRILEEIYYSEYIN
ncbi:hypothetical protein [Ornithobacterium rhinotracheale]|uniref:hypothetical protein n=1 Tax=Ornithobacterium rhinotracheale TaxID=28251 RepID=UPI0040371811